MEPRPAAVGLKETIGEGLEAESLCIQSQNSSRVRVAAETLRRSSGNAISILFISSFVRSNQESATAGTLRYCCLINYVWGRKKKSPDTLGALFKRAALLREETLALIKRHTFISAACNDGFLCCQRRAPDAGGSARQWPLRIRRV